MAGSCFSRLFLRVLTRTERYRALGWEACCEDLIPHLVYRDTRLEDSQILSRYTRIYLFRRGKLVAQTTRFTSSSSPSRSSPSRKLAVFPVRRSEDLGLPSDILSAGIFLDSIVFFVLTTSFVGRFTYV